jgi:hypothetical protein
VTLKILERVGEQYGRWQNKECRAIKKQLLDLEAPGTGRVPLSKFYGKSVEDQTFTFMESLPYLRMLGTLDETNSEETSVIIPNYVTSPSNCVAESKFYSVCCIDECEALMGSIEAQVGSSEASPDRIIDIVSGLSSDSVEAPRDLPTMLSLRLEEIAARHSGTVPLHGRLFAQWMHHAFPRECSFPHMSGTTQRIGVNAFTERTGISYDYESHDVKELIEAANSTGTQLGQRNTKQMQGELPWSVEEELFVCRPQSGSEVTSTPVSLDSCIRLLVGVLAVALLVAKLLPSLSSKKMPNKDSKHYV